MRRFALDAFPYNDNLCFLDFFLSVNVMTLNNIYVSKNLYFNLFIINKKNDCEDGKRIIKENRNQREMKRLKIEY